MDRRLLELRKFLVPEFIFGVKALALAGRYARNLGIRKALLVTDPGVIQSGWTSLVIDNLESAGIKWAMFEDITPNPRDYEVAAGADIYQKERCNGIIAVGGGSPMDCAKGIGIVSGNGGIITDYEGVDKVSRPIPPLICIPTTAGTSADVSQFAIIIDSQRKLKIAIISKMVVPDVALIDPETTTTLDDRLTAATGLDALTHAIEAYVSNASSLITDLLALDAISLIFENLIPAIENPHDIKLRASMMLASLEAGMAFSNASLGAVHAMAHSLGGYLDLPHGECNSLLLEHVIDYNYPSAGDKYDKIAQTLNMKDGTVPLEDGRSPLAGEVRRLRELSGIRGGLADIGVKKEDLSMLSENAMKDACMVTNPRKPNHKEIVELYERVL